MKVAPWSTGNAERAYPFQSQTVVGVLNGGDNVAVPTAFLADVSVTTAADVVGSGARVSRFVIGAGGASCSVYFDFAGEDVIIVIGTTLTEHTRASALQEHSPGLLKRMVVAEFTPAIAALVAPYDAGDDIEVIDGYLELSTQSYLVDKSVPALSVVNESTDEAGDVTREAPIEVAGNITLVPGYNVEVSQDTNRKRISIDARVGAGKGKPPEIQLPPSDIDCADLIYFINGQSPDWLGRFFLRAGPGMKIETDPEDPNRLLLTATVDRGKPRCK